MADEKDCLLHSDLNAYAYFGQESNTLACTNFSPSDVIADV